jgi:hypothetical protein
MCLLCVRENLEKLTPLELIRNFVEIVGDDRDDHADAVADIVSEHLSKTDEDELVNAIVEWVNMEMDRDR